MKGAMPMPGNLAAVIGGLIASGAALIQRLGPIAQAAPSSEDMLTGAGVVGAIAAITGVLREWFRHRETMADSKLKDRVELLEIGLKQGNIERDRLRAELDQVDRQFGRAKHFISVMLPALQADRAIVIRANARYPDEFPLPDGFMDREFDRHLADLFGPDSVLAIPPSRVVAEMIEGTRPMPPTASGDDLPAARIGDGGGS